MRSGPALLAVLLASCASHPPLRMSTAGDVTHDHRPARDGAQGSDAGQAAAPPAWLWEVRREGSPPSYVLGTMHIGIVTRQALPPPLDAHLYEARSVVMEIDPREIPRMLTSAPRRRVSRRQMLDRALPPATWSLLVDELGARIPPELLRAVPPGVISLHLLQVRMAEVEAQDEGRTPVRGAPSSARLDASLFEWAVSSGRPVVPLETPEQSLAALAAISDGSAIDSLRALVDDAETARAEARALRDAYLRFDEAAVLDLLAAEATPEFREILLIGRNRAWMERLVPELERGDAFVAVGLAHLLGAESVLSMLAERGFRIRRLGGAAPASEARSRTVSPRAASRPCDRAGRPSASRG